MEVIGYTESVCLAVTPMDHTLGQNEAECSHVPGYYKYLILNREYLISNESFPHIEYKLNSVLQL